MRLTLRTMLAYLDDILEPADREEIGRKIEESEFARQLVPRLRDCMRNPRLSAPKVSGKGTGLDPNTVAEYLDNTLAGERVPDFEKVCLESDVFLAEVAACHQILTMVLGQPAEIDPQMKQLMYGIVDQVSPPSSELGMSGALSGDRFPTLPDEIWVKPLRRKPEIPDYLRERPIRSRWKSVVAAAVLLLILVGAITMALGPLDHTHPVARLLGFGQPPENQAAAVGAGGDHNGGTDVRSASTPDHSAPAATQHPNSGGTSQSPDANSATSQPSGTAVNTFNPADKSNGEKSAVDSPSTDSHSTANNSNPTATVPVTGASANDAVSPPAATASVDSSESLPPKTDSSRLPPPIPEPPSSDVTVTPTLPADANRTASTDAPRSMPTTDAPMPGDTAVRSSVPVVDTPPPQPVPATDNTPLGRLLPSKGTVLLKFDAASGQWSRVPSGAAVTSGEQLLVLPTYRPTLTLSAGLTLQVPAETLLELEPPDAHGIPTVKLIYGRFVAMTTGKAGAQLGVDVGGARGVVSFVDGESTLGVEVRRYVPVGANPEVEEPHIAADLYAKRGRLEWNSGEGTTTALNSPQRWVLSSNPADGSAAGPMAALNMPKWIDPEQLRSFDAQAPDFLAQSLQDDKPLLVALREMVEHRRVEYKALGVQCLALLDEFEPLVATFNDPDQRPMWSVEIASVKAALARGPATAAKVHEVFVKQHDEELGKELYRMFLGYTKEQLQAGEAAKLVDFLDHDNLDCRVLAFANLQDITNKTFNYRPEAPAAARAQPLRRWQEELRNNAIIPREAALQK